MIKRIPLILISLFLVTVAGAKPSAVVLEPEPFMRDATKWATTFLTRAHYRKTRLDDELSGMILDRYLEALDPNRIFFLGEDIRAFERYRQLLDDGLRRQQLDPAFEIFNVYNRRVAERTEHARRLLKQNFNFNVDETLQLDRSEEPWAETPAELDELWRKRVKNDLLRLKLAGKELDDAKELLEQRYDNLARRVGELDSEDVFQYFLNAVAESIEPHTGYLAPRTSENFNISMRLSLEGIGAVLQRDNEYTAIRQIVAGGPADRDGRLGVGDRIVSVAQESEQPVDVVGWRLDDVVDLIRGAAGSKVTLGVLPAEQGLDGEVVEIDIIRDRVKLEEQAARSDIFELQQGDETIRVGVIDLPAFYIDFAARQNGLRDYRSASRDVRALLESLKQSGVDAVVVDLRNNGGGSLDEATALTGLFIDEGPVVQVRTSSGKVEVKRDEDQGVAWDGPLAVLVNRHSASASEIFAAAIQDYGRGLIIGEPTFGKGTVQDLVDLDRYSQGDKPQFGQLRLTIAQFFRINGGSTQHRGVIPDITFPTLAPGEEHGESSLANALPWTSIRPANYQIAGDLSANLPILEERSRHRISDDLEFNFLLEDLARYRAAREDTTVSLLESKRREELNEHKTRSELRRVARTKLDANGGLIRKLSPDAPEPELLVDEAEELLSGEEADEDEAGPTPDEVILEEALRVMGDFVALSSRAKRTAQLRAGE